MGLDSKPQRYSISGGRRLKTQGLQMLVQIRAFLAGSTPLSLTAPQREAAL
jgi:hypothetical protein